MATVKELVKARLPYLITADDALIDLFEYEVMVLLQKCFNRLDTELGVSFESLYTPLQLSLIADLVTIKLLLTKSVINASGSSTTGGQTGGTYLKRAKAGSVEAEFALPQAGKESITQLGLDTDDLLKYLKNEALIKAGILGCSLAALLSDLPIESSPFPFAYFPLNNCGGCGC